MDDSYLTVDEIAELLKLNPQTIRNMIERGELPAVRVGVRRVRVLQSDLDEFLAQGRGVTRRSDKRIAFDDAVGAARKALRRKDNAVAVTALRSLSSAALALAEELSVPTAGG